ncbi:MAG: hypothetical protein ABIP14_14250 [Blastocatellia bacterium]
MTRSKGRNSILDLEHKSQPVLRWPVFLKRLATSFAFGLMLILASLFGGMAGYHHFEKLPWIDAFVNAAMILSGMGPLAQPATQGGKLFAGLYAIYSGLAVVMIAGITFAPVVHRFLHKLHADEADSK